MDIEKWIYLSIGFAAVFIGAVYHNTENKRVNGRSLTVFQRFLFGTGFAYFLMVLWTQFEFFTDYYVKGAALQGYNAPASRFRIFFALFGTGVAGEAQYPVLSLDLSLLAAVLGCACGGVALLINAAVQNKMFASPSTGLFYGWSFPKTSLGDYVRAEYRTFRQQVHPAEYVSWWVLRVMMIVVLVKHSAEYGSDYVTLQLAANLAATFIIPLVRVLFFAKLFFGNINYRVQSFINIFVLTGSFMGQGLGLNGSVAEYDKLLHFISGGVAVFIGCLLIETTREGRAVSKYSKTAASVGFSCTVMVVWEMFEFFADYYMPGMCNQNWGYAPASDLLFFRVFGFGAQNPGQMGVLDTNLDLLAATVGCVLCGGALLAALTLREKLERRNPRLGGLSHAHTYLK